MWPHREETSRRTSASQIKSSTLSREPSFPTRSAPKYDISANGPLRNGMHLSASEDLGTRTSSTSELESNSVWVGGELECREQHEAAVELDRQLAEILALEASLQKPVDAAVEFTPVNSSATRHSDIDRHHGQATSMIDRLQSSDLDYMLQQSRTRKISTGGMSHFDEPFFPSLTMTSFHSTASVASDCSHIHHQAQSTLHEMDAILRHAAEAMEDNRRNESAQRIIESDRASSSLGTHGTHGENEPRPASSHDTHGQARPHRTSTADGNGALANGFSYNREVSRNESEFLSRSSSREGARVVSVDLIDRIDDEMVHGLKERIVHPDAGLGISADIGFALDRGGFNMIHNRGEVFVPDSPDMSRVSEKSGRARVGRMARVKELIAVVERAGRLEKVGSAEGGEGATSGQKNGAGDEDAEQGKSSMRGSMGARKSARESWAAERARLRGQVAHVQAKVRKAQRRGKGEEHSEAEMEGVGQAGTLMRDLDKMKEQVERSLERLGSEPRVGKGQNAASMDHVEHCDGRGAFPHASKDVPLDVRDLEVNVGGDEGRAAGAIRAKLQAQLDSLSASRKLQSPSNPDETLAPPPCEKSVSTATSDKGGTVDFDRGGAADFTDSVYAFDRGGAAGSKCMGSLLELLQEKREVLLGARETSERVDVGDLDGVDEDDLPPAPAPLLKNLEEKLTALRALESMKESPRRSRSISLVREPSHRSSSESGSPVSDSPVRPAEATLANDTKPECEIGNDFQEEEFSPFFFSKAKPTNSGVIPTFDVSTSDLTGAAFLAAAKPGAQPLVDEEMGILPLGPVTTAGSCDKEGGDLVSGGHTRANLSPKNVDPNVGEQPLAMSQDISRVTSAESFMWEGQKGDLPRNVSRSPDTKQDDHGRPRPAPQPTVASTHGAYSECTSVTSRKMPVCIQAAQRLREATQKCVRLARVVAIIGVISMIFGIFAPWGFQSWACGTCCLSVAALYIRLERENLKNEAARQGSWAARQASCPHGVDALPAAAQFGPSGPHFYFLQAVLVCSALCLTSGILAIRASSSISSLIGTSACGCLTNCISMSAQDMAVAVSTCGMWDMCYNGFVKMAPCLHMQNLNILSTIILMSASLCLPPIAMVFYHGVVIRTKEARHSSEMGAVIGHPEDVSFRGCLSRLVAYLLKCVSSTDS